MSLNRRDNIELEIMGTNREPEKERDRNMEKEWQERGQKSRKSKRVGFPKERKEKYIKYILERLRVKKCAYEYKSRFGNA